ncbi:MAG: aspartate 1-decarboxylase [Magnetospiraceae bacterium]
MRKFVHAKLHGIHVTGADLDYHGSITLDPDHCEAVGIVPLEFVEVWNKYSGARISTYVIYGERGSKCCVLNGAAARTCEVGDPLIICSSIYADTSELTTLRPKIITFNRDNSIADRLVYETTEQDGKYAFQIKHLG